MAQTPKKDAEAGTPTSQTVTSTKDDGLTAGPKTVSARVFTDFAAI